MTVYLYARIFAKYGSGFPDTTDLSDSDKVIIALVDPDNQPALKYIKGFKTAQLMCKREPIKYHLTEIRDQAQELTFAVAKTLIKLLRGMGVL